MNQIRVLIVLGSIVLFAAGAVVGMLARRMPSRPQHPPSPEAFLVEQLGLTDAQQKQMREIWSRTLENAGPPPFGQFDRLNKEREQAIRDLLSDDQKAQYDRIAREYSARMEEIHKQSRAKFKEAEEQTKALLTPEQLQKYEEILKRGRDHGPGGPGGPGGKGAPGGKGFMVPMFGPGPGPGGPGHGHDHDHDGHGPPPPPPDGK
ncbi:MAG TPA: Spy/CpxP family protein refolding chaperone [Tepidisphaeraceae bacterium]|jgi:Spy/CpxP family protein refolding chaperone